MRLSEAITYLKRNGLEYKEFFLENILNYQEDILKDCSIDTFVDILLFLSVRPILYKKYIVPKSGIRYSEKTRKQIQITAREALRLLGQCGKELGEFKNHPILENLWKISIKDGNYEDLIKLTRFHSCMVDSQKQSKKSSSSHQDTVEDPIKDFAEKIEELKKQVLHQEETIEAISLSLYEYLEGGKTSTYKTPVHFLVGPSGCGKTMLASTLGEIFDVPVLFINAGAITEQGIRGDNLSDVTDKIKGFARKAHKKGIIVLDEFDKLLRPMYANDENRSDTIQGQLMQMFSPGRCLRICTEGSS